MFIYVNDEIKFKSGENMKNKLGNNIKGFIENPETIKILEDNSNSGILIVCRIEGNAPKCSTEGNYMFYVNSNNSNNLIKYTNEVPYIISSPVQGYYIDDNNNIIGCNGSTCSIYNNINNQDCNKIILVA